MALPIAGQVGPQILQDGATQAFRQGRGGEQVITALHGAYFEQNFRGNLYSAGIGLTAINNATYTTGTLTASVTPVLGIYNPIGSPVNLVPLFASLGVTVTAATSTGGAPFVWATTITTTELTATLTVPMNRKTLKRGGGFGRDITNVAPTGMTPNLTVCCGSALGSGSAAAFSFVGTAVGQVTSFVPSIEYLEGSWIVPPGGVLVLLATTTPVAHSAASCMVFEEVPI